MSRNIHKEEHEALEVDVDRMQQLMFSLGRRRSLRDPIASTCEQLQFTPPQVHALLWLGLDGTLTMGELAKRLGVTEKTVTGVVDRLEREGHLQRERGEADRRIVRCRLTDKGRQTFTKLDRSMHRAMGVVLGMLDAEDRQALFRVMEKVLLKMDAPATEAPPKGT
ncbi:MarR family winged helix-turn-helix transcriptional regulator [Corallococcus llansteffanensis]|uniref:MarR family transcriptional regulator n=1 Tax=Corallococcus llansteffanensis TaxID=2316731 RepID=A0A3A8PB56_9BACT|nr:MarR family transcriptional regulator [Corallococcus llansteffanensis]RKH53628.1 MarR family transcriptional regulator [Corallococcus llansteffanensis]